MSQNKWSDNRIIARNVAVRIRNIVKIRIRSRLNITRGRKCTKTVKEFRSQQYFSWKPNLLAVWLVIRKKDGHNLFVLGTHMVESAKCTSNTPLK